MHSIYRLPAKQSIPKEYIWYKAFFSVTLYLSIAQSIRAYQMHTRTHANWGQFRTMYRILFENNFDTQIFAHEHVTLNK